MPDGDATALIQAAMPLCAKLGIRAQRYTREEVALTLEWAPDLCTTGGLMHGGAIMALADSAGGACAMLNLPADASGTASNRTPISSEGSEPVRSLPRPARCTPAARPSWSRPRCAIQAAGSWRR